MLSKFRSETKENVHPAEQCSTLKLIQIQKHFMQPLHSYSFRVSYALIQIFQTMFLQFLQPYTHALFLSFSHIIPDSPISLEHAEERKNLMPRCQNCGFKWSWKDMMKLSFKSDKKCPNCHKKQYVSGKSSFWGSLLFSLPFIFVFNYLRIYMDVSWLLILLFFIIYLMFASLLMPFVFKLSNTKRRF